jgi:hypothetical protein
MSNIMHPYRNAYGFLFNFLDSTSNQIILQENDTLPTSTTLNNQDIYYLLLKNEIQQEFLKITNVQTVNNKKVIDVERGKYSTNNLDWEQGTKVVLNKELNISTKSQTLCNVQLYDDISYDNRKSGLNAGNVQNAIDELDSRIDILEYDSQQEHRPYYAHRITLNSFDSDFPYEDVQTAIEQLYNKKSSKYHTHANYYLKSDVDSLLSNKSETDHTHNDFYTKNELKSSGLSEVHWDNILDPPLEFVTDPTADGVLFENEGGLSAETVQDALVKIWNEKSELNHTHNNFYTKEELSTNNFSSVHWGNIIERPDVEYASGVIYDSSSNIVVGSVQQNLILLNNRVKELEDINTSMSNLRFDNFTIRKTSDNRIALHKRIEDNIMLNAFRIAAFTNQSDINMVNGFCDEFLNINNIIEEVENEWEKSYFYSEDDKYICPNGWNTNNIDYKYRRKLTIDSSKLDGNLENYTVLVKLDNSNFNFSHHKNNEAHSEGTDIKFWLEDSDTHEKTQLNHEIVRFNPNSSSIPGEGEIGEFWVKIPNISSTADLDFYMYYGNINDSEVSLKSEAWDINFNFISHLSPPDGYSNNISNSTNPSSLKLNNSEGLFDDDNRVEGLMWRAIYLPGLDNYGYISTENLNFETGQSFTIQVLVKPSETDYVPDKGIVTLTDGSNYFCLGIDNDFFFRTNTGIEVRSNTSINTNNWYILTATYSSETNKISLFVNGTGRGSATFDGSSHNCKEIQIGHILETTNTYFKGNIEELRISKDIKDSTWIKADYRTQFSQDLVSVSNEEDINSETDMTLISKSFNTDDIPTISRILILEEKLNNYILNSDLKTYISRDNGENWNQVILESDTGYDSNTRLLSGQTNLEDQLNLKKIKWKIETENNAMMKIKSINMVWN